MKTIFRILPLFALTMVIASGCGKQTDQQKLDALNNQKIDLQAQLKKTEQEIDSLKRVINKTATGNEGKPVFVTDVKTGNFRHSIDVQARVDAEGSVTVYPEMGGKVTSILVKAGQTVSAGQTLATLDNTPIVKQAEALKTQKDLLEDIYKRQQKLWEQKVGSEVQLLQAKASFEAVEDQYKALQAQAAMASVRAPISGTVDMIHFKVGDIIAPGIPGMGVDIVGSSGQMKIKADIAEAYINKVKTGNKCEVYIPDLKKTISATVTHASSMINRINRTFGVEVVMTENDGLKPNMIAVLKVIDYEAENVVTIPQSLIQIDGTGARFVFVAEENGSKQVAKRRDVVYENSYNGTAEIKSGLKTGDKLITAGYNDLEDNKPVSYSTSTSSK